MAVVGIGASAGGLDAFTQVLHALPADPGFAMVLVQHLAPQHESALANLLSMQTSLPVVQVTDGQRLEPNHVYVIPPNVQAIMRDDGALSLLPRPTDRSQYTPIDAFLRSLAEVAQDRAIGVILSGTASDGTQGVRDINAVGGFTFAQTPETARYDGMPRAAHRDRAHRHGELAIGDRGRACPAEPHPTRPDGSRSRRFSPLTAEAERLVQDRYAPPGVVVDRDLQIVQFRGQTGLFLEPAAGDPSLNVLKMAREGLLYGLRSVLNDVRKGEKSIRKDGLRVRSNGGWLEIDVEALPLTSAQKPHYLVLFHQRAIDRRQRSPDRVERRGERPRHRESLAQLERELQTSRDYLQSIIQELEAANEELQSANEEILSANEELQSTNEELDTAKEELQSTNEELNTVNEELQGRNEELSRVNSYLLNLLASVQIAIVIVTSDLRIRRFTPMAERMLNLIPSDVGRPIGHIKPNIDCPDLEQMTLNVIESVAPRNRFLAALSHELRTPLTPILLALDALAARHDIPNPIEPTLRMVRRNVEQEARLIDDLLDVTRIAHDKLRCEHEILELHALLRDLHAAYAQEAASAGIAITLEVAATQPYVLGDAVRLKQIVSNLLRNAIRHTAAGGTIAIRSETPAAGRVRISVRDWGTGISPALLKRIFIPFEQADRTHSVGLGLGLAIAKGLVEQQGGTIAAHSDGPGTGATFTVELPTVQAPAESHDGKKPAIDHASRGRTVLLVEDHADSAEAIELGLASAGYRVVVADSVRSALSHADEQFDVVVSDLGLPDGSGLDVMRGLLTRRPILGIALSGFGAASDVRSTREAGFQRHLVKPVDLSHSSRQSRASWHRTGPRPRAAGCKSCGRIVETRPSRPRIRLQNRLGPR